jgi:hypothetical protein
MRLANLVDGDTVKSSISTIRLLRHLYDARPPSLSSGMSRMCRTDGGYRRLSRVGRGGEQAEILTFVMLRRMILVA